VTEPFLPPAVGRVGPDGRTAMPSSITAAVVLGIVQAGLSALATVLMVVLAAALAGAMEVEMGDAVWVIAVAQLAAVALMLSGALRLRSGKNRALYLVAAGLQVVNCLAWFALILTWSGAYAYLVIPLGLGTAAVVGLVAAAKPSSAEYVRTMRDS
jgi:hypothetical protein